MLRVPRVRATLPCLALMTVGLSTADQRSVDRQSVDQTYQDMFPAWSPDGRQVTFTSTRDGDPEIYITTVDGGTPRRLTTTPGRDAHPAFSPDGRQIVFQSPRRGGATRIFIMDADGSNQRPLTDNAGFCGMPVFSADAKRLAFQCSAHPQQTGTATAPWRIFVMGARGGPLERVTEGPGNDQVVNWSRDGRIVFHSDRDGSDQLYLLDMRTRQTTRITAPPGSHRGASFSPDGRVLSFLSDREGSPADVFVMAIDGSDRRRLTRSGPDHGVPFFSPDGQWVLYERLEAGQRRIWMAASDGTAHRPLFGAGR